MVTLEHSKMKTTGGGLQNYISYFQSVTTIGIINRAKTPSEAEIKARKKLTNSDFMCGVVGQTPFDLHATDEWKPTALDIEDDDLPDKETPTKDNPIIVNLESNSRQCIADKMNKKLENLTDADCLWFLKWSLEQGLS